LRAPGVDEAFVRGKFRESRDAAGRLDYLGAAQEERLLASLDWIEV
jgi:hypothetical protein